MCYKRRAEKPKMPQPEFVFGSSEKAGRSPVKPYETAHDASAEPMLAMNYCPRCSACLAARSCKLICPGCGYYMSCADFY
jgi:hypothetical protein